MISPFLQKSSNDWICSNEYAFAIWDGYPVNPGHVLIVPFRAARDWFSAFPYEQTAIMDLITQVKSILDEKYKPDGYNVGFNVGDAGGQTVFHLHVHVIPRYNGDMEDPRGGVRHVIPERGNYRKNQPR